MSQKPSSPRAGSRLRRSAARLAAVQALYQHASSDTSAASLLHEFHNHRLDEEIDGLSLADIDRSFFDDIVAGVTSRTEELDTLVAQYLGQGWTVSRLDRLMLQILRAGAYELLSRPDVPRTVVVTEYVHIADAFYPRAETGFVNALLDRMGKALREG